MVKPIDPVGSSGGVYPSLPPQDNSQKSTSPLLPIPSDVRDTSGSLDKAAKPLSVQPEHWKVEKQREAIIAVCMVPRTTLNTLGAVINEAKINPSIKLASPVAASAATAGTLTVVAPVLLVYDTFCLVRDWKKDVKHERALKIGSVIASTAATVQGVSLIISGVPAVANLLTASMGVAGTVASIAGPIGSGLVAVLYSARSINFAREAHQLGKKLKEIEEIVKTPNLNPVAKAVMEKVSDRVLSERKKKILDSIRSLIVAIGAGLATAAAIGALAGLAVTPVGWAAAGVLLTGFVVSIGISIYRSRQNTKLHKGAVETLQGFGDKLPQSIKRQLIEMKKQAMYSSSEANEEQILRTTLKLQIEVIQEYMNSQLPKAAEYATYVKQLLSEPGVMRSFIEGKPYEQA